MRKIQAAFYTFEEMEHLLERCCFTSGEDFDIEVIDHYYTVERCVPDDAPDDSCFTLSDFDALPVLSKVVGFRLVNTHVSRDGIWLEGEEMLPKRKKR